MSGNLPDPTESGLLGKQLEGQLGISTISLLTMKHRGQLALTAARLTRSGFFRERSAPLSPAPAFSIFYLLGDLDRHSYSLPGSPPHSAACLDRLVTELDLRDDPHCEFRRPLD